MGQSRTASSSALGLTPVAVVAPGVAGEVHALFRLASGNVEAILRLLQVEVANTGNNIIRARLVIEPTLGGAAPVYAAGVPGGVADWFIPAGQTAARAGTGSTAITASLPIAWRLDGTPQVAALILHSTSGSSALVAYTWGVIR